MITLSADRPAICSLDSLDNTLSSRNWHNRCLTRLLIIAGVIAVLSVIAAVLAYITILEDECTCDRGEVCNYMCNDLVLCALYVARIVNTIFYFCCLVANRRRNGPLLVCMVMISSSHNAKLM